MCGLYSLTRPPSEVKALFALADAGDFPPRTHVAPGQPIAAIRIENGERRLALLLWGFIPSWMKEPPRGKPLINARGETVLEKPSFRNAMRRRRCLVPADAYFEWSEAAGGRKAPYRVRRPDGGLFAFGALWEHWMGPDGSEIETAALMTIAPNAELSAIHDRMPVIIAPADHEAWLTGEAEDAARLIRPAPDGSFVPEPVVMARAAPPERPDQLSLF